MSHRFFFIKAKHFSVLWAALCALSLVLACGLKEPLHFLSHEASGTASVLEASIAHQSSHETNHQTHPALELAHDTCLLKAFFEANAQNSFSVASGVSLLSHFELVAEPIFRQLPAPASQNKSYWQSSRGPPQA